MLRSWTPWLCFLFLKMNNKPRTIKGCFATFEIFYKQHIYGYLTKDIHVLQCWIPHNPPHLWHPGGVDIDNTFMASREEMHEFAPLLLVLILGVRMEQAIWERSAVLWQPFCYSRWAHTVQSERWWEWDCDSVWMNTLIQSTQMLKQGFIQVAASQMLCF